MDTFTKERPKLPRHAAQVRPARPVRRLGLRAACRTSATIADDIAIVRSMATDVFNHGPAKLFVNTGSPQFGRPSMGSWVTYGIGSESQRPARLRRAAVRPARPARRRRLLGQRLPADRPTRACRSAPAASRSSTCPARRASTADAAAASARRRPRPERGTGSTRPATRRSPRASPPTRWPTACRPAPRS